MTDTRGHTADDSLVTVLGKVSLFAGLSRLQLVFLLGTTSRVVISAGDLFFDEGDAADSLYVFVAGEAVVEKKVLDNWRMLATLKPGQTVGEMAVVDRFPRSARVRAVKNCLAIKLNSDGLERSHEIAATVYRNIAGVITARLRAYTDTDDKRREKL
jgi:CRP-like cAMP-binding protein